MSVYYQNGMTIGLNVTSMPAYICLLYDLTSEEDKAEKDSFETDLVAGILQEEVVRVFSVTIK